MKLVHELVADFARTQPNRPRCDVEIARLALASSMRGRSISSTEPETQAQIGSGWRCSCACCDARAVSKPVRQAQRLSLNVHGMVDLRTLAARGASDSTTIRSSGEKEHD